MERGKEGTRAKPGNQLVYYICIHLLDPHWNNMGKILWVITSAVCDLYTTTQTA